MNEQFKGFIAGLRDNIEKIRSYNEDTVKQGVILPCLHNLGWEVFNTEEVKPEYSIDNKRVDYALRLDNKNKIFLEAKKPYEDLERHQEQLLMYAFKQSIKVAILTNGLTWQFYLPMQESEDWRERRCYTIDIVSQDVESIIEKFIALLSKVNVKSGVAFNNAQEIFNGKRKKAILKTELPKAWNKIISEPDSLLVDIISKTVEVLSGYKPEHDAIITFLKNHENNFLLNKEPLNTSSTPNNQNVKVKTMKETDHEKDEANHAEHKKTDKKLRDKLIELIPGVKEIRVHRSSPGSPGGYYYQVLNEFPGAFFDDTGYVLFKTEPEFRKRPKEFKFSKTSKGLEQVNIRNSISKMQGYKKDLEVEQIIDEWKLSNGS